MHSQVCITRHMLFDVAAKIMWLWVINVKVLTLNGSIQQWAVECSPVSVHYLLDHRWCQNVVRTKK